MTNNHAIHRHFKKVNGVNLFYLDTKLNNQPLLCLHGKYGRGATWTELIKRYADRYRIIAPDQRGHGLSDKPINRYAGEDFAKDAHGLLETLEVEQAIVAGHSIGGRNAAYLAALFPESVKALIIIDGKASGPEEMSDFIPEEITAFDALTGRWPVPFGTHQEAVKFLSGMFKRRTNVEYFLDSLKETHEGYDFIFTQYAMTAIDVYYQGWYHILEKIQCPVLFIRAKNSWYLMEEEAAKMRKILKNCKYYEINDSDHMVYADNENEFYPVFDKFLNEIK